MLYSTLLAGLLTTSAFASPLNVTAPFEKRAERKYCDSEVLNADPPNNYCYQFCDTRASRVVGINRESFLATILLYYRKKSNHQTLT